MTLNITFSVASSVKTKDLNGGEQVICSTQANLQSVSHTHAEAISGIIDSSLNSFLSI